MKGWEVKEIKLRKRTKPNYIEEYYVFYKKNFVGSLWKCDFEKAYYPLICDEYWKKYYKIDDNIYKYNQYVKSSINSFADFLIKKLETENDNCYIRIIIGNFDKKYYTNISNKEIIKDIKSFYPNLSKKQIKKSMFKIFGNVNSKTRANIKS